MKILVKLKAIFVSSLLFIGVGLWAQSKPLSIYSSTGKLLNQSSIDLEDIPGQVANPAVELALNVDPSCHQEDGLRLRLNYM